MTKLYIKTRHPKETKLLCDYLEMLGFKYGYDSVGPCQRKAYSNMNYITVHGDCKLYSGSKGGSIDVDWHKLERTEMDVMRKELNGGLSPHKVNSVPHKLAFERDKAEAKHFSTKDVISSVVGGSFKREAETLYWTTNDRREIYISDMDDDHLHNTILFIDRAIRNGHMAFSKNHNLPHFLSVMEDERTHRGLPMPLLPIKSLAYRRKNND